MLNNILNDNFIRSCTHISNTDDCQLFLDKLYNKLEQLQDINLITTNLSLSFKENDPLDITRSLLCFFSDNIDRELGDTILIKLLSQEDYDFILAITALYIVHKKIERNGFLKSFLLSESSFVAPKLDQNARYFLTAFMGYSGNNDFIPILYELLTKHYHFHSPHVTVAALRNLDAEPDDEDVPYNRSITVNQVKSEIWVSEDERYSGSSECPNCRFFPCRINRYYSGGIEDCNLWNKTDPEKLGDIEDRRDWGDEGHLDIKRESVDNQLSVVWKQARQMMMKKRYRNAIPLLCSTLLQSEQLSTDFNASITPLSWIYLAHCFSIYGEKELEFIAMREASKYKKLIPVKKKGESKKLMIFNKNLSNLKIKLQATKPDFNTPYKHKTRKQWVKACDYYTRNIISNDGKYGGGWFEVGECHRELGEYHLALLFMEKSVALSSGMGERNLYKKFSSGAEEIRNLLKEKKDIGLAVERRREERKPVPIEIKDDFRLDTYEFTNISKTTEQLTKDCKGISDYFALSKEIYTQGDFRTAIEVMKASVNYLQSDRAKASPLHMIALLHCACDEYDKAIQHIDWAISLKPDKQSYHDLKAEIEEQI